MLYGTKGFGKPLLEQLVSKLLAQDGSSSSVIVSETKKGKKAMR
jgi:hypothetical protein